jgi:type IV pilus assembly protein PilN
MYNIDINFLKDRPEYQGNVVAQSNDTGISRSSQSNYSKTPIYVGLGVSVLAILATAGGWLFLDNQTKGLQAKQAELDQQLGKLKTQETELAGLNGQIGQIEGESKALAGVFNSVRPWSAILQDFRESIPQGVQIRSIGQIALPPVVTPTPTTSPSLPTPRAGSVLAKAATAPADPGAQPSTSPSPTSTASPSPSTVIANTTPAFDTPVTKLKVTGVAQSFNDVNNFVLTLKKSAFLNPDDVQLITANLVQEGVGATGTNVVPTKSVKYEIQTSLKQVPAPELLSELERKGAIGLVTRLKSLQQQQVVKP